MTTVYNFDEGDLGKLMPNAKEFLAPGKTILVWGVSEASVETGEFEGAARSLFWNLPTDENAFDGNDYWGLLLSDKSAVIRDALKMVARKRVPFAAFIQLKPKVNNPRQSAWVMKPSQIQYDQNGDVIDPNA